MFVVTWIFCLVFYSGSLANVDAALKVSIYYDALSPEAVKFITSQVYPTYSLIGTDFDIDLVPYGTTEEILTNGKRTFSCEHGEKECYANKIQACAIHLYSRLQAAKFVNCAMASGDSSSDSNLEECTTKVGMSFTKLNRCVFGATGTVLLSDYGKQTKKFSVTSFPTVIFNDKYDEEYREKARTDFLGTVCALLNSKPEVCQKGLDVIANHKYVLGRVLGTKSKNL